ncbi:MAG: PEP-CTERM sorting domain-containing protein, partial [Planctomycetes bacterium]|nr:PEP-CTERM sorting domain-containing protein [Planctomycetota bacterium]
ATSTTIRDYSAFTGSGASVGNFVTSTSAYYASVSGTSFGAQDNNNPYYQSAFPGPLVNSINSGSWASVQNQTLLTGTITNGIAGMAWREFKIERTGTTVTWSIDTTPIARLSGTSLALDGATSLTYFDPTSGVASSPNLVFGLVSSYSVELVPEPTTLGLLAAAAAGAMPLVGRWRRRRHVD